MGDSTILVDTGETKGETDNSVARFNRFPFSLGKRALGVLENTVVLFRAGSGFRPVHPTCHFLRTSIWGGPCLIRGVAEAGQPGRTGALENHRQGNPL